MNHAQWKATKGRFEIGADRLDTSGAIITANLTEARLGWGKFGADDLLNNASDGFPPKPGEGWSKTIQIPVIIDDAQEVILTGGVKLVGMYLSLLADASDATVRFRIIEIRKVGGMIGGKWMELHEPVAGIVDAVGVVMTPTRLNLARTGAHKKAQKTK